MAISRAAPLHPILVHDEQKNILLRRADLKTYTAAFDTHRSGSGPASSTRLTAHGKPATILGADNEAALLEARNSDDALSFVQ